MLEDVKNSIKKGTRKIKDKTKESVNKAGLLAKFRAYMKRK